MVKSYEVEIQSALNMILLNKDYGGLVIKNILQNHKNQKIFIKLALKIYIQIAIFIINCIKESKLENIEKFLKLMDEVIYQLDFDQVSFDLKLAQLKKIFFIIYFNVNGYYFKKIKYDKKASNCIKQAQDLLKIKQQPVLRVLTHLQKVSLKFQNFKQNFLIRYEQSKTILLSLENYYQKIYYQNEFQNTDHFYLYACILLNLSKTYEQLNDSLHSKQCLQKCESILNKHVDSKHQFLISVKKLIKNQNCLANTTLNRSLSNHNQIKLNKSFCNQGNQTTKNQQILDDQIFKNYFGRKFSKQIQNFNNNQFKLSNPIKFERSSSYAVKNTQSFNQKSQDKTNILISPFDFVDLLQIALNSIKIDEDQMNQYDHSLNSMNQEVDKLQPQMKKIRLNLKQNNDELKSKNSKPPQQGDNIQNMTDNYISDNISQDKLQQHLSYDNNTKIKEQKFENLKKQTFNKSQTCKNFESHIEQKVNKVSEQSSDNIFTVVSKYDGDGMIKYRTQLPKNDQNNNIEINQIENSFEPNRKFKIEKSNSRYFPNEPLKIYQSDSSSQMTIPFNNSLQIKSNNTIKLSDSSRIQYQTIQSLIKIINFWIKNKNRIKQKIKSYQKPIMQIFFQMVKSNSPFNKYTNEQQNQTQIIKGFLKMKLNQQKKQIDIIFKERFILQFSISNLIEQNKFIITDMIFNIFSFIQPHLYLYKCTRLNLDKNIFDLEFMDRFKIKKLNLIQYDIKSLDNFQEQFQKRLKINHIEQLQYFEKKAELSRLLECQNNKQQNSVLSNTAKTDLINDKYEINQNLNQNNEQYEKNINVQIKEDQIYKKSQNEQNLQYVIAQKRNKAQVLKKQFTFSQQTKSNQNENNILINKDQIQDQTSVIISQRSQNSLEQNKNEFILDEFKDKLQNHFNILDQQINLNQDKQIIDQLSPDFSYVSHQNHMEADSQIQNNQDNKNKVDKLIQTDKQQELNNCIVLKKYDSSEQFCHLNFQININKSKNKIQAYRRLIKKLIKFSEKFDLNLICDFDIKFKFFKNLQLLCEQQIEIQFFQSQNYPIVQEVNLENHHIQMKYDFQTQFVFMTSDIQINPSKIEIKHKNIDKIMEELKFIQYHLILNQDEILAFNQSMLMLRQRCIRVLNKFVYPFHKIIYHRKKAFRIRFCYLLRRFENCRKFFFKIKNLRNNKEKLFILDQGQLQFLKIMQSSGNVIESIIKMIDFDNMMIRFQNFPIKIYYFRQLHKSIKFQINFDFENKQLKLLQNDIVFENFQLIFDSTFQMNNYIQLYIDNQFMFRLDDKYFWISRQNLSFKYIMEINLIKPQGIVYVYNLQRFKY